MLFLLFINCGIDEFLNLYRNISFSVTKMLTEQMNWTAEVAGKNVLTDMENMGKYYEKSI